MPKKEVEVYLHVGVCGQGGLNGEPLRRTRNRGRQLVMLMLVGGKQ